MIIFLLFVLNIMITSNEILNTSLSKKKSWCTSYYKSNNTTFSYIITFNFLCYIYIHIWLYYILLKVQNTFTWKNKHNKICIWLNSMLLALKIKIIIIYIHMIIIYLHLNSIRVVKHFNMKSISYKAINKININIVIQNK